MRSSSLVHVVLVLTALGLALQVSPAAAQDTAESRLSAYRAVARVGQEAFNSADYERAQELWRQARDILPNPRIYRLLGRSAAALGDHVEAVRMYRLALRVPDNGNPLAEEHRQNLEGELLPASLQHVGQIELSVEPADATVSLDGEAVEVDDAPLVVAPGSHRLAFERADLEGQERGVDVAAGELETLRVQLGEPEAPTSSAAVAEPGGETRPVPDGGGGTGPDLVGPLVLFGVAGVGAVVFAVTGGLALGENDALADECGSRSTGSCSDDELSDLHTFTALSDVGWITALAAAAAGGIWLAVELAGSGESESSAHLVPVVTDDTVGVALMGALQ